MAVISGNEGAVCIGTEKSITGIYDGGDNEVQINFGSPHGLVTGNLILIRGVVDGVEGEGILSLATALNGKYWIVEYVDADSIIIKHKDTLFHLLFEDYSNYVSGGKVQQAISITEFSLEEAGEVSDVTDSTSSTYKDFVAVGFVQSSGKFKGWLRQGEVLPSMHVELDAVLYFKITSAHNTLDLFYSGKIIIQNISHALKIDSTDAVVRDFTWISGTGGLTKTDNIV